MRVGMRDRTGSRRGTGTTGRLRAMLPLVVVALLLGPVASAVADHKSYTADVSPHNNVAAGATHTFTATLTNTSDQHQLGSADITPPFGFTLGDVVMQPSQGTATVEDNLVKLRDLSAPPGTTVTVAYTAEVPCEAGSGEWQVQAKQANNFNGPPGNDLVLDEAGSNLSVQVVPCRLNFFTQPTDAERHQVISSQPFDPTGAPVQVEVLDGQNQRITTSTAEVTVTIGTDPNQPEATATLSGTTTRTAVGGVAPFDDLSLDLFNVGYTLVASSSGLDPATSTAFDIWEQVAACEAGQPCENGVSRPLMETMAQITSGTSGFLPMSVGVVDLDCGDTANHAPEVVTLDSVGLDGTKTVTMTVAKEFDQLQPNNGVAHYEVCFQSDTPFTDKFGNTTTKGLLPDCEAGSPTPPCVLSKTKDQAGDVVIEVLLPAGDPSMT